MKNIIKIYIIVSLNILLSLVICFLNKFGGEFTLLLAYILGAINGIIISKFYYDN